MPTVHGLPKRPNTLRLRSLDYRTQGAYFVTVRVRRADVHLARITATEVTLSRPGEIVQAEIDRLGMRYAGVRTDEAMIMPDHVHLIVWLESADAPSLSTVVGGLKAASADRINRLLGVSGRFWQSRFYDRYIRDDRELEEVRQYIRLNPERWRAKHGLS